MKETLEIQPDYVENQGAEDAEMKDNFSFLAEHRSGLTWPRLFSAGDPYASIRWEKRDAKIAKNTGEIVFEQKDVEVPDFWSQTATDIVASKYFRGRLGFPEREWSARQMVDRVANTIAGWGLKDGYFASEGDFQNFRDDLKYILINQHAAFNSPVWFNVGIHERPQSSACQPFRALVSTPFGFYKIGEIVKNNLIGLPVYDSSGITRVLAVKNNGIKKVYKINLRNGSFIEATGDHLIKAVYERRTKPIWARVDQLKKGMRLQLYPHYRIFDKKEVFSSVHYQQINSITAEGKFVTQSIPVSKFENKTTANQKEISEAALAGWLQADGFVGQYFHGTNNSLTIEFMAVNREEKEWIESNLDIVFPEIHRKVRITKTKIGTPITRIRLYGKELRSFVERYELLKRRLEIRVPDILWRSSPQAISAYLKSVFQGEGYVSIRGKSTNLALATISKDWISDLQILLYGLGIYSRILFKKEKRNNRHNLYELRIGVGSERIRFAKLVGFIDSRKQYKLLSSLKIQGQKNIRSLREEEITGIQEIGEENVYDIQTQSGEYLTNNVAVHNCFILSVNDTMQSILEWYRQEGIIFKGGSGSGINLSGLRSSREALSKGGFSSGPVSFMKGADGVANSIKSGGTTRRAAKMVVLNADHPDIKSFIYCKKEIEDITKALERAGIKSSIEGELFNPYTLLPFQNANNSVRVTDEFMQAVENDDWWDLKSVTTGETLERVRAKEVMQWIADACWHSADPGMQYDTTVNNWHTCPNTGRINATNPCGEYNHLDDSACNLSSINLLKFLKADGEFDVGLFKKAVDTMITAQDIIVDNSSYPTEKITKNAKNFRQLGLGYANLGAFLMTLGLPYDSDEGRAVGGAITALLTGEAYLQSAKLAAIKGPFAGYAENEEPMLGVIKMHLEEAEKAYKVGNGGKLFDDEELSLESRNVWHEAHELGQKYGIRNSQATVIAPTGTISFLLDCATTGVEPELALVKYKKLVGGGTLRLVNNQVGSALAKLGYNESEIREITNYILEKDTIEGAPHLKPEHLPVFDCSFKPANGQRSIHYLGHLKMMGAVQPFVSGAISKTINLPSGATVDEIYNAFVEAWKLGLKAVALYRDGCKTVQPLNTVKDELVERVGSYVRTKLPEERPSVTHKFSVAGHEGYLTVGLYPDSQKPGETFITIAKEGSTVSGLFDVIATLISVSLQSGVPLKTLVRKFKDLRFEPSGATSNNEIPFAKSIIDYIFKYLGAKFLPDEEKEEVFGRPAPDVAYNSVEQAGTKPTLHFTSQGTLFQEGNSLAQREGNIGIGTIKVADSDAPVCECGTIMHRMGSCYSCPNCFATTGVCN